MNISNVNLENLSSIEKKAVLDILNEYATTGKSDTMSSIVNADYIEYPVDIETFITDDKYLGKAWKDANGNLKLYSFWLDRLKELFPTSTTTAYTTVLESGARGIGKSEIAAGIIAPYQMYRIMCLKNPLGYFNLKPTEKIVFAFLNIKLELAEGIATDKFQKTVQQSPWFMSKGRMTQRNNNPYWVPPEPISIVIGSQSDDVVGLPVYYAFADEVSFVRNQDIDKQKKKAKDIIDTAIGGMVTRFVHEGKNPTTLVVASSKRSEQSFMESYIRSLSETDPEHTLIIDKPVWEVKPDDTYNNPPGTFNVALGNKYLENLVIPDGEDTEPYVARGYQILKVPNFFKAKFIQDIDRNLCDIAGISTASSNKYFSGAVVAQNIQSDIFNPFPDIIEVGNGQDDLAQYKNFFNIDNIPIQYKNKPLFIHLDMSISGDMTGIAGVWIIGKKPSTESDQSKDLMLQLAFSTSVKAPKGHQVSFEKNRNFIRWLKDCRFNIKEITADTFQSYDLLQQLKAEGYNCEILSVDRVAPTEKICLPYQALKNVVYEHRLRMYKSQRLLDEFVNVERNINTGRIDHTSGYHKDALDAVCGAVYTAGLHAEEYAYDYGENLEVFNEFNSIDKEYKIETDKNAFINEIDKMLYNSNVISNITNPFIKNKKEDDDDGGIWVI